MKAAVIRDVTQPPRFESFVDPKPGAGEVLLRPRASALSQLTRGVASGRHYSSKGILPLIPGVDGVGLTETGARVYFAFPKPPFGAMAELCAVPAANVVPVPDEVDDVTAAAIANPGMSSWAALAVQAGLQPGETVLINGATGASGRLAIRIARHLGAGRIAVTGRTAESVARLEELGVDETIPLDQPEAALEARFRRLIGEGGADVVLDYLWGPPAGAILAAAASHGGSAAEPRVRFVQIGSLAGLSIPLAAGILRSSGLRLMGSGLSSVSMADLLTSIAGVFGAVGPAGLSVAAEAVPLSEVTEGWTRKGAERIVFTL